MRLFVATILLTAMFVGLVPAVEAAPGPLCTPQANERIFWQDGFKVASGWTNDNDAAKPNQWQTSEVGNGDESAWYIGREGPGGETGYASNAAGANSNSLYSPIIDARLFQVTCVEFDIMGSSEGTSTGSDMSDWLQVDVQMPGVSDTQAWWQGIGSYSGTLRANGYQTVGAPIQPGLDIQTPPVNPPPPSPPFPAATLGGDYIQMRFSFYADENVDSFFPPCTRESFEANGNQCTTVQGMRSGYGWFVDNVRMYGLPLAPEDPNQLKHKDRLNQYPNSGPEFESFDVEMQRIDIIRDAGQIVPVTIKAKDDHAVVSADVFLISGDREIQVTLSPDPNRPRDWYGEFAVDDVRLLVGEYTAIAFVADERGNLTRAEDSYTISVTANDAHLYPVNLGLAGRDLQANPEVALAAGGSVQVVLEEPTPILRDIRFQMVREGYTTPPLTPIGAPYILTAEQFPQGEFELVLVGRDRAHQVGTLRVPIVNDQTIPLVTVHAPDTTYQNVEFPVIVSVKEQTSHQVRFQMDGKVLQQETNLPNGDHVFNITRSVIEDGAQFKVTVEDRMSNTKTVFGNLDTIMAFADASMTLATVPADPKYMPGDDVKVLAVVSDNNNPRVYPYEVIFKKDNRDLDSQVQNLKPGLPGNFLYTVGSLRPGMHQLDAFARVEGSYEFELNEMLDETESASVTFEVYLGRVEHDNKTWYVRADGRGQPYQAIDLEFGFTYNFTLQEFGNGTRYMFTVGEQELYWDPLQQVTVIPTAGEAPPEPREVPGVPLMVLVAMLALAVRRKRSR